MAVLALVTANRVEVVGIPVRQMTGVAGEAVVAGAPCVFNTSGAIVNGDGNGASPLNTTCRGIALKTVATGETVTLLQEGRLDGFNLDSQAYSAPIYVSDTVGILGDAAGTATLPVGYVEPAGAHPITSGRDKILHVNVPAV